MDGWHPIKAHNITSHAPFIALTGYFMDGWHPIKAHNITSHTPFIALAGYFMDGWRRIKMQQQRHLRVNSQCLIVTFLHGL